MFSIDILLFFSFLALNLGVGLWYSRGVKTLRQYAIGDKQFSTIVIALTIVATQTTGSGLITWTTYKEGLFGIVTRGRHAITFALLGLWFVRAGRFLKHLTVAEAMGSLYGRAVRVITALCSVVINIGYITMQLKVAGIVLSQLFGVERSLIMIIGGGVIITYSALGGIRAVAFTDVLQFLAIGVLIPFLALKIWFNNAPSSHIMGAIAQYPNMSISAITSTSVGTLHLLVKLLQLAPISFSPPIFQRMQMARDVYQAKKSFLYAALITLFVISLVIWINILSRVENPNIPNKSALISYLFTQYATSGFRGIMAIGIMAMVMSTADSFLNSTTVLIAHDLILPFSSVKWSKVLLARATTLLVGVLSLCIALANYGIREIWHYAQILYVPVVLVPLMLNLFGFRSSTRSVLLGMGGGLLVTLFCPVLPRLKALDVQSVDQGLLANLILLLGSHYLLGEPGGWMGARESSPVRVARKMRMWWWRHLKKNTLLSVVHERLLLNLPQKGEHYFLIGLYAFLSNYLALYGLKAAQFNSPFFQGVLYTLFLATSLVMTYPAWPKFMKRKAVVAWAYPVLFGYAFFVATPIIAALAQYKPIYLMLLLLHLVMAILIFSPHILFAMLLLGTFCSFLLLQIGGIPLPSEHILSWNARIAYLCFMLLVLCLVLLRHQATTQKLSIQNYYMKRLQDSLQSDIINLKSSPERFISRLGYGQYNGLNRVHGLSEQLLHAMKKKKVDSALTQQASELSAQIKENATYLDQMMYSAEHHVRLEAQKIALKELLSILSDRHAATRSAAKLMVHNSSAPYFFGDRERLEDTLAYLIHKTAQKAQSPYLFLAVTPTKIVYPSTPKHFDALAFSITSKAEDPPLRPYYIYEERPEVRLSSAAITAERHYGHFEDLGEQGYIFVLPEDIRATKPKMAQESPGGLSNQVVLNAKKLEGAFWSALFSQKTMDQYNLARINLALNIMKAMHGYQLRDSGDLFYTHPLQVATYLLQYSNKEDVVIAALLHDTVEDTDETMEELRLTFGDQVREIVQGLTNLKNSFKKYKPALKSEKVIELCLSSDPAIGLIKLCDRLHNMHTLEAKDPKKREGKAEETLAVYVPLARKLGFKELADELERLSKRFL